ncbi:MAG: MlaD family protein [Anaeromyxobacter sp.]
MKPAANKALAVGVLVALTGAAFLLAFTFLKKGGYSDRDSYLVHAYFADATGLTWKSRAQIAGIQIGEVSKIALEGSRARLDLRIRTDVELHADACLYKTFPSALLPDALLDVSPGTPGSPLLSQLPEEQREITCVREATSVQQLLDSMAKIAADVQTVTGDLAKTVNSEKGSLSTVIQNLAQITDKLDRLVDENDGKLGAILSNAEAVSADLRDITGRDKQKIHNIIANVEALTAQLRVTSASLQTILDGTGQTTAIGAGQPGAMGEPGGQGAPGAAGAAVAGAEPAGEPARESADSSGAVAGAPGPVEDGAAGAAPLAAAPPGGAVVVAASGESKDVRAAVARLNDSLGKLDSILGKVNEGKSVAGKLLVDEKTGREVGQAVDAVTDYFNRLNKLQIQVGFRSEWLLNQSVADGRPGAKVYFGARLLPRPDKFYDFEIVSDPRGVDTVTTETITTRDPSTGEERTTVSTRTKHEDKLTFSLQFGKRFGPATFRAGIIESAGGVGTDLHFLDDALQFSLSLYQFQRPQQDVFPRAKFWANYNFGKHFYVTTGVDDFLNRWRTATSTGGRGFSLGTDVFIGGGLFFTDDDIKTLMLSGAGSAAGAAK